MSTTFTPSQESLVSQLFETFKASSAPQEIGTSAVRSRDPVSELLTGTDIGMRSGLTDSNYESLPPQRT